MALGLRRTGGPRPSARHRIVERRVYVQATPAVVWAALHDARNLPAIYRELRLGPAEGAWPAAGAVRQARLRLGMLREPATVESLEARPSVRFRYRLVAADLASEWSWLLEPRAGGTRVVHAATVHPTSALAADRWTSWLAGLGRDAVAAAVESHLGGLKACAETTGAGHGPDIVGEAVRDRERPTD